MDQVNKFRYKSDIPNLIAPCFSNVRHNYKAWNVKLQMFPKMVSLTYVTIIIIILNNNWHNDGG